ncbi:MAG TPA: FAD-binding oxidoreductase [Candidatus Limnocylindria bacterium]|jgi:FAD/FMN-containing dehydrogenase
MSTAADIRIPGLVGRTIEPGDADYDAARATFYGGIDKRPRAIVRVANAEDVAKVVNYARTSGVELAVRSGGHSATGLCLSEGGVVVDLHDLRAVEIDLASRTVWAGTGITAVELAQALDPHDLALSFGDTGSVAIGGLVTGGGVGYLVRKHGLTIDSVIAAEVVTADGQVRRVDDKTEPDLFWAIRGGGGNFGVVTRFQFRAAPLGECFGGMFMIPATAEAVRRFIELSEQAPEELSTIANVMAAPPMPFLPAETHGKLVIFALVLYAGPAKDGERVLAPLREIAAPLVDMVKPMRYHEIYPPEDPSYHPIGENHNMFLDRVDAPTAELIVREIGAPSQAMIHVAQLRVLGGAYARVPADATAFAHRRSKIMVNVGCAYTDPSQAAVERAWVARVGAALRQTDGGAYVNFLARDAAERIRAAYPGKTYDRLALIKRQYDPVNLFRLNANIPPLAP